MYRDKEDASNKTKRVPKSKGFIDVNKNPGIT